MAVNDRTGKVVRKSDPLPLFIRGAQALTAREAVAAELEAEASANIEEAFISRNLRWFLLGGILLIVLAAGLAVLVMRAPKEPAM